MTRAHQVVALVVCLIACYAAAALGGIATSSSVSGWYQTLKRPGFQPPGWVFGPVWSVLYTLMAVAAWLVYRQQPRISSPALILFSAQLILNTAWSFLFFGLRRPDLAAIEILLLLAAVAATTAAFWRVSIPAAALMLPYLLWVSYATVLNIAIWLLNRPAA
jgi:tryptophan-rich sensory protein